MKKEFMQLFNACLGHTIERVVFVDNIGADGEIMNGICVKCNNKLSFSMHNATFTYHSHDRCLPKENEQCKSV